ncbi:MAG: P27 family phage terminase small subunit [Oscillospiraceae bacterium]
MLTNKKNAEIKAVEMPPIKEYLKEIQRDGSELGAEEVLKETFEWLDSRGAKGVVSVQLVEQYAFSVARWIHLERLISKYGYIAKHPTTGAPIQSPYVVMSQSYMKQVIAIRGEINLLLKDAHPTPTAYVREVVYGE